MLKITAISITSVIFAVVLKKAVPEFSLLLMIVVGIFILTLLQTNIQEILESMVHLAELSQINTSLLTPIFKTVAISIISKITAELCRSGGESGLATFVELAGSMTSLVIAIPLMEAVMELMGDML